LSYTRRPGVKYYLIADPQFDKIEIYQLIEMKYQPIAISPKQFMFLLAGDCELSIDFTAILV
jgi:Uma2 family endonuclease